MKPAVRSIQKKIYCFLKTSNVLCFSFFLIAFISLNGCKKINELSNASAGTEDFSIRTKKTNIILILADDVGFEVPTCNGGQSYTTPNIDEMAAEGIRFPQSFASPLCSPSRFMLLTGKYNFRNYGPWGVMDTTNRTIANMLRDAGYKTLVAGKWQLDGGDVSIHALGFDDYLVYAPFEYTALDKGSRYKNPTLYKNGKSLSQNSTKGKYGEDMLVDYINDFIDSNKNKPFFIYYPVCLCHYPFCPTPDDPDFAAWDPKTSTPNKKYFPSMVKYMDKKIGEVIDKVKSAGIAKKTIIIYVGDNGTDNRIQSLFNDTTIKGGKSFPYATGTQETMIVWSQGTIAPGQINNILVDFTDFLPTIADIAKLPKPATYGTLDGVSFYPYLFGQTGTPRDWVFCSYDQNEQGERFPIQRWINNSTYKLFDSTGMFYNIQKDMYEKSPIPNLKLTPAERKTKKYFQSILDTLHN